jgi:hypothetical protein
VKEKGNKAKAQMVLFLFLFLGDFHNRKAKDKRGESIQK